MMSFRGLKAVLIFQCAMRYSTTREKLGFEPKVGIEEGIRRFVDWYRFYYGESQLIMNNRN